MSEIEEVGIAQLQSGLNSGEYTTKRLVELYAERIREKDGALRSVLELNLDAEQIAEERDAERASGRIRGPLHGIPVLLKDNIATNDLMETTAGSLALVGAKPKKDAPLVKRLRKAGAVILGKTNLSEWANFRSSRSVSGWSGRGGQTRNPYALDRTPSGSSSGSGSAIAASFASVAVGTETDGSILSPAAACSLVGIKPTLGLISRTGIIPIAHSQDTAGPMARSVHDAAVLLGVLAGTDSDDPATLVKGSRIRKDYAKYLDPNGLQGKRIGIARKGYFGYSLPTDKVAEEAIVALKDAGAILIDPADLPVMTGNDELEVLLYEFKADLNAYLKSLGKNSPMRSLKDLIAFNEQERAREMPFFGQEWFERAQEKGPLTDSVYKKARRECIRLTRKEGIDAVIKKHRLDALFAPTQGPPGLIDFANRGAAGGSSTSPAAVAGYPSITVPAGYYFGLPIGVSFFGRAWSEPTLIKIAYAFEQATKARRPPTYAETAPFPRDGFPR